VGALQEMTSVLQGLVRRVELLEETKAPTIPSGPTPTSDEVAERALDALRGKNRPPKPSVTVERCKSDLTEATFDAYIEDGVVKDLLNYTHPENTGKHQRDGGIVPDGIKIQEYDAAMLDGDFSYVQWRYENYWKVDNRRFIGKPLPKHVAAEAEAARKAA